MEPISCLSLHAAVFVELSSQPQEGQWFNDQSGNHR
jgi:hypothetical protein